jgi:lysophospholipase L1-like esterase
VAESYNALFIPLHPVYEEATKYAPPEHWAKDGVHPTPEGASLMAYHWLKAVQG